MTDAPPASELFQRFDPNAPENEDFANAFRHLLSLTKPSIEACLKLLPDIKGAPTSLVNEKLLKELADHLPETGVVVSNALACMGFFADRLLDPDSKEDTPSLLAHDLLNCGLLDEEQRDRFTDMLTRLVRDILPQYEAKVLTSRAESSLFAEFEEIATSVELQPIRKDTFDSTKTVEQHVPDIQGLVAVASVAIDTDDGGRCVFKATRGDLTLMISYLEAAIKDLDAIESHIGQG